MISTKNINRALQQEVAYLKHLIKSTDKLHTRKIYIKAQFT